MYCFIRIIYKKEMAKKCPPGVFCIENITLGTIALILIACFVFIYLYQSKLAGPTVENHENYERAHNHLIQRYMPAFFTSYGDSVNCRDPSCGPNAKNVYLDPHAPAQKINFYMQPHPSTMVDLRGPPMVDHHPQQLMGNRHVFMQPPVMTQPLGAKCFSQIGILTDNAGTERILPLFGRPLQTNRNKWQYYTMNDSNNIVYTTNLNTGVQYKYTAGEWVLSFEGEYHNGSWRIVL